ncbi:MAG: hypothetical protein K9G46_03300 [Flavobacteriales bacterium]|nr:hypothetical protein [Flavobacteriales bacterium]
MKKLLFMLTLCSAMVKAQNYAPVEEQVVPMDGVPRNSLTIIIKDAKTEDIKKAWKKQLKDLKCKVSDKTFIFGDDCKDKEVGSNTFDIYSVVEEATDKGVKLVVAFDLGGAYLSKANHPDQYPIAEKIVYAFAVEQARELVRLEMEATGKILSGFEKELAGLEKDKAGAESNIVDYEKKIAESKTAIEVNLGNQANKLVEINTTKAALVELEVRLNSIK